MPAGAGLGNLPIPGRAPRAHDQGVNAPLQSRVFQRAAELLGGSRQLSTRLGVSQLQLSRWMASQETSSLPAFLDAVDVILASDEGFAAIFTVQAKALH